MKSLLAGFRFLLANPLVGGIALLGFIDDGERECGYCIRRWLTTGDVGGANWLSLCGNPARYGYWRVNQ
ncbi:hypothetical protein DMI70_21585 [Escherichia coli]|nr:hypothetical protein [Escherichia coli]